MILLCLLRRHGEKNSDIFCLFLTGFYLFRRKIGNKQKHIKDFSIAVEEVMQRYVLDNQNPC